MTSAAEASLTTNDTSGSLQPCLSLMTPSRLAFCGQQKICGFNGVYDNKGALI